LPLPARFPEDEATPAEIRALDRAKREFQRGEYVTLDQLHHELESSGRKLGPKKAFDGYLPLTSGA
jgi:hypothetical protein